MSLETTANVTYLELGNAGTGLIAATATQQDRLDEFTNRVGSGEFHRPTNGTIPCKCIDGRCGSTSLMPNAAGGSETLMVADDLTVKRFVSSDDSSTCGQYTQMLRSLKTHQSPVGGHTAAELRGAPSGCGANDKLKDIYAYIVKHESSVRQLAAALGLTISDEDHQHIVANAIGRVEFSDGSKLLSELKSLGGEECVDVLRGSHTEVLAIINTRSGTTLDRDAVETEFGDNYEAFNVDVWAFPAGARAISTDNSTSTELYQKQIAMTYYNLATAGVLCAPNMRVVVLK